MPVSVCLAGDGSLLLIEGVGRIDDADYLEAHLAHLERPLDDLLKIRWVLSDWSKATEIEVSAGAVRRIAEANLGAVARAIRAGASPPPLRLALVAPGDVAFGLSRMFEMMQEGTHWTTQVFRDRTEALAWLQAP